MNIEVKRLSDREFERRSKSLILEYVDLVKKGLPDQRVARWNEKLDRLPETARLAILDLVEINPYLKDALSGRGELFESPQGKSR